MVPITRLPHNTYTTIAKRAQISRSRPASRYLRVFIQIGCLCGVRNTCLHQGHFVRDRGE